MPVTTTTTTGGQIPSGPTTVFVDGTIIENRHFTGTAGGNAKCLNVQADDVVVRNSTFTNCGMAIYGLNAANLRVEENVVCEAWLSDRGRNCVQFDKIDGGYIGDITITAPLGTTNAEDHISVYQSRNVVVEFVHATGGGDSGSGSCIMLGDGGGGGFGGRNLTARFNTCIDAGQVGIAIAGGANNSIIDNEISHTRTAWSNVGIFLWNYNGQTPAGTCTGHVISGNEVNVINKFGQNNPFWNGGGCSGTITGNSWQ